MTHKALLQRERNFATVAMAGSVWTFNVTGAGSRANADTTGYTTGANATVRRWSTAMATPIFDVKEWKREVQMRTGHRPNIMVMGRPVFDALTEHEEIIDRLNRGQTSGPAQANMDDLKRLLELDDIIVMDSIYNSAVFGATASYNFIGDDDALLLYRPNAPGLEVPSAGYMFSWRGYVGVGERGMRVKRFRMEQVESDRVEISTSYQFKVVGKDLGFWATDIV